MRRIASLITCLFGFPLTASGQEATFDDSFLLSDSIIASSQSYQIKKLSCEVAGILTRGNLETKNMDIMIEANSQGAAFHCAHSLEQNTLVLGIHGEMQQTTMDGVIIRYDNLTTEYQPYLAFQLSPSFSVGISEEIGTGEYKSQSGSYSASTHRLILSGSFHQDQWEATLVYADRYRDSLINDVDLPRGLGLAVRYQFAPLLTAGLIYTREDFPGIADGSGPKEFEIDSGLILASNITAALSAELSFIRTENTTGDANTQAQLIGVMGRLAVNEQIKIAGFFNQYNGDTEAFKMTMSAYGFSVSMAR